MTELQHPSIQLDSGLFSQIQHAADRQGQTVADWCADLFEAALGPYDEPIALVERVYRLEQIVARMSDKAPCTTPVASGSAGRLLLTERQQAALDLVERRWRDGQGETTAADLVGEAAGCDLEGRNAPRLARKVLAALARMELVQERRAGVCIAVKPINAEASP